MAEELALAALRASCRLDALSGSGPGKALGKSLLQFPCFERGRVAARKGLMDPAGVQRRHFGLLGVERAAEPGEDLLIETAEVLCRRRLQPAVKLSRDISERQTRHG